LTRVLIILTLVIGVACTPANIRETATSASAEPMVWPDPPQEPRIRHLYSFSEPVDLGIKPGAFARFIQIFAGKESQRMLRPYAIAADDDMIAVVDPGLKVVHLYMTKQAKYEVISDVDGENFMSPIDVSLGPGVIYITDSALGKVFVFNREGEHQSTITGLVRPTGIAFHRESRRLYVTDTVENQIVVFDDQGARLNTFGSRGGAAGDFNFPTSLTLHGDILYVNDTMNFRIQAFTLDGSPVASFGGSGDGSGQFALSKGLGADMQGHLYVADALSNYIQIFDAEGRFLLSFGGMGGDIGQFRLPAGIYVLENRIFVADSQNQRVQVFEYIGGST